ncbi:hypothetical protein AB0K34_14120 [Actinomadura sp. NPDC049382]|uniref:hypothetical protein n=1 Tax=Actinomadura sp. NPDC049382 TaxID=3158220 RepID=UPI00341C4A7C
MTNQPTTKTRQIVRALPSPTLLALIGGIVAVIVYRSNPLALSLVMAFAIYNVVFNEVTAVFDPDCDEHQHNDCPVCGDLPPLVQVRSAFQRITRKATSR